MPIKYIHPERVMVMTCADHHVAAADYHKEAAEHHEEAAAHYTYGDYQKANEHARLAQDYGQQAEARCLLAMR